MRAALIGLTVLVVVVALTLVPGLCAADGDHHGSGTDLCLVMLAVVAVASLTTVLDLAGRVAAPATPALPRLVSRSLPSPV